ncbi:hypothetical protein MRB53_036268 [Persea americana]|nr:hypothetical protein MRB53_036446 [Persea americana]KAJ8614855.1 hypothetical protein MRB53_036268 [Persea americana]
MRRASVCDVVSCLLSGLHLRRCATGYDSRYGMFTGSAIERFLPY